MNVNFGGMNGTVQGDTGAAYTEALVFAANGGLTGKAIIRITDVDGATKTMYYKVDGYLSTDPKCVATALTAETDVVSAVPVVDTAVDKPYAKIVVSVKDHSASCNYLIDWMVY
jgi:hypothetical protein